MRLYPKDNNLLEFDKIRQLIASYCHGTLARETALTLKPQTDISFIKRSLNEVHEFSTMLTGGQVMSLNYGIHLQKELNLLRIKGSVLRAASFYQIKLLVENISTAFHFFKTHPSVYPTLETIIYSTYEEKRIINYIDQVIDTDQSVRSDASEELYYIRTQLSARRNELQRVFSKTIQRLSKAGMLIESEQSIRNGRKVVAIYSEHKRQVKGIVHGISDTGKTSYIEPEESVELNNVIVELEQREREEIYRILKELTERLAPFHELLVTYQQIISQYDFIYAKAKLAVDMQANMPRITTHGVISLKNAYHPLLYLHNKKLNKPTVPLTLELNHQKRILVISGPNAGGKTICLKLVGLIQIMVQSGLLVPVASESELGVFNTLMVSMGDTQSIEYELSTYSAHLKMMKHFVLHADKRTLFLIDEFGTGSDPTLGGAFAEAILEHLSQQKAIGVVTTHYLNLKTLADRAEGIINGSMEFDEVKLLPLYRLLIGKPGSSYTFAIAERIGVPKPVVERAKSLVKKDQFRLEKLLRELQRDKQLLNEQRKELQRKEEELKQLQRDLEKQRAKQEEWIQQEIQRRTKNVLKETKEAEQRLKNLIGEWNKAKDKSKLAQKIAELTMKHKKDKKTSLRKVKGEIIKVSETEIQPGDEVRIISLNRTGRVEAVRKKNVIVNVNGLPIEYDIKNVEKIERIKIQDQSPTLRDSRGEDTSDIKN